MKKCSTCKKYFDYCNFTKSKNERFGVGHECRVCRKKRMGIYRANNREKCREYGKKLRKEIPEVVLAWSRKSHYKKKYGIDYIKVIEQWEKQNKKCEICSITMVFGGWKANSTVLDHDHKTNELRGIICANCNHALGLIKDNKEVALSIIRYLEKYT